MGNACSVERIKEHKANVQKQLGLGGRFKVPNLNHEKFDAQYQVGKVVAPKVAEARNKITMAVDVVYKLPKSSFPCSKGSQISAVIHQLQKIEHPNICRLVEGFDDAGCIYLVYQKVAAEPLHSHVLKTRHMSERRAAEIGWQLARALFVGSTCEPPIVHGALVPKNVLIDVGGCVKLTDLGLVDLVKPDPVCKLQRDTLAFMAPEVVKPWVAKQQRADPSGKRLVELQLCERPKAKTAACDVWSLGVILFQLMSGKLPFHGQTMLQLGASILKTEPSVDKRLSKVSTPARELVRSMLTKDPGLRPSLTELMTHPWLPEARHSEISNKPLDPEVITHLMTVNSETQFKKFVMRLVSEKIPANQIKSLEGHFARLDLDGDGLISLAELTRALGEQPEMADYVAQLQEAFNEIDEDHSGKISVHEFVAATLDTQGDVVQNALWDTFKAMDADHDGKLTKKELRRVVQEVQGRLGKSHIDEMVRLIELEVTEDMSFEDFCHIMTEEGARLERRAGCCGVVVRSCRSCKVHG